jgi:hypothetical protein
MQGTGRFARPRGGHSPKRKRASEVGRMAFAAGDWLIQIVSFGDYLVFLRREISSAVKPYLSVGKHVASGIDIHIFLLHANG